MRRHALKFTAAALVAAVASDAAFGGHLAPFAFSALLLVAGWRLAQYAEG
jgi:hypothetical protein